MENPALIHLAVGPGIALAIYIYYSDKWDRESKKLVFTSFLLGGLACFSATYAEMVFEKFLDLEDISHGNSSV